MKNMLSRIFDPQLIKLNLDGKTKEMVFTELIDAIAALYPQCNRAEIFTAIRKREEKMSTGIGCGVAIPHIIYRGIGKSTGAIGVSQHGIDFDALDGKPVNVVFLLILNEQTEENHLRVLNQIFKLTQSEAITEIKNAKNVEGVHDILSQTNGKQYLVS